MVHIYHSHVVNSLLLKVFHNRIRNKNSLNMLSREISNAFAILLIQVGTQERSVEEARE
jgi:hypothetical protein